MKRIIIALLLSTPAVADPCDYVGRHYKTDVAPVAAYTYPASRTGDIVIERSLRIAVKNVGVNAFTDPAGPGDIIHARQVGVFIKGRALYGWLSMPLAPGATADLSVNVPEDLVATCERVTATIDANGTLGQAGCRVHDNDAIVFTARFGARFCDIIRPHP